MLLTFIGFDFSRVVKMPQAGMKITLLNMLLTFIGLTPALNISQFLLRKIIMTSHLVIKPAAIK